MAVHIKNYMHHCMKVDMGRLEQDLLLLKRFLGRAEYAVGLCCMSDKEIKSINATFRDDDRVTDVLSFPVLEHPIFGELEPYLGDTYMAMDYIKRTSEEKKLNFEDYVTILCAHSLCHLIGHDHILPAQTNTMRQEENRILAEYNKLMGTKLCSMTGTIDVHGKGMGPLH